MDGSRDRDRRLGGRKKILVGKVVIGVVIHIILIILIIPTDF